MFRSGSLTAAAPLLGLSRPTVTAQIRTLEQQTGRELFTRLPRGMEPTAYAHELADRIALPLDTLAALEDTDAVAEPVHLAGPSELLCVCVLPALLSRSSPTASSCGSPRDCSSRYWRRCEADDTTW